MVKDIDNLDIAVFPNITKLDKWILAIKEPVNKEYNASILVSFVSNISCINCNDYVISGEGDCWFHEIEHQGDIRKNINISDGHDNNFYFTDSIYLYACDNFDELIEFAENVMNIYNLLN